MTMFEERDIFTAPGELRQEQRREFDPTIIADDDADLEAEQVTDNMESAISGMQRGQTIEPKIKITTSGAPDVLVPFGECLQVLIPNATFETRLENAGDFAQVRERAVNEGYTDLLVLVEANNEVHTMMHLHLPYGPAAHWRVTSIALPKDIQGHARTSQHYPEIMTKRFETRMGKLCARMLRSLFPATPDPMGRRAVTFHHQRDFIFFRHYRYIFESAEEVRLQECGPKFTLKLLWLQEGPFDPENGLYTFYRKQRHEKSRRRWWM